MDGLDPLALARILLSLSRTNTSQLPNGKANIIWSPFQSNEDKLAASAPREASALNVGHKIVILCQESTLVACFGALRLGDWLAELLAVHLQNITDR